MPRCNDCGTSVREIGDRCNTCERHAFEEQQAREEPEFELSYYNEETGAERTVLFDNIEAAEKFRVRHRIGWHQITFWGH
jgi:tRNA(Ile2) C34 agmatinyltransferase TiaS